MMSPTETGAALAIAMLTSGIALIAQALNMLPNNSWSQPILLGGIALFIFGALILGYLMLYPSKKGKTTPIPKPAAVTVIDGGDIDMTENSIQDGRPLFHGEKIGKLSLHKNQVGDINQE